MRRAIAFFSMFSLLLALAVPSFAVYDIQDDTSPVTAVEGSLESLYDVALASGVGIVPYSSSPNYWSPADISNVVGDVGSMEVYLRQLISAVGTYTSGTGTIYSNLYAMKRALGGSGSVSSSDINGRLYYIYRYLSNVYTGSDLTGSLRTTITSMPALTIPDNVGGYPVGKSLYNTFPASSKGLPYMRYLYDDQALQWDTSASAYSNYASAIMYGIHSWTHTSAPLVFLGANGRDEYAPWASVATFLQRGLPGLASVLRGSSGSSVSGKLINYADLSDTDFSANNILSMLSPLLTVQNDLARIGHVIADPQDQAIKDANKDNYKELENLSKGDAALKPSDIGDMAGVSGDLSGMLDTGVSIGDAFDQANGEGALAFFSQQTANDLDTTVQTYGSDDGFVHPDWSNWSLLEGVPLE